MNFFLNSTLQIKVSSHFPEQKVELSTVVFESKKKSLFSLNFQVASDWL